VSRAKRRPQRRQSAAKSTSRPRRRPPAPEVEAFEQAVDAETLALPPLPPAELVEHEPEVALATPEPGMAARVPPPAPERSHPDRRRAIFFDVENTSRAEHIARVIEHLAVDRMDARTDFIAVGNWRVIGHDTARLLAKHGAQLIHSAPSVGVRDWSDLRIAVAAGVWLAAARAGDVIELISDDRAFDAVGDVAASLGIAFRRLSFRRLVGMRASETVAEAPAPAAPRQDDARGRGRRRGRRGGRGRPHGAPMPMLQPPPSLPHATTVTNGEPAIEPHTAPHDEIVSVVQELIARASDGSVSIDTLANALKSRGFRRTPGSPRLITRLRRIREIAIDRGGRITLVDGRPAAPPASQPPPPIHDEPAPLREEPVEPDGNRAMSRPMVNEPEDEPTPGNELAGGPGRTPPGDVQPERRRRRSRRGGRGRRRGRSGAPAAP
jgi:hypothetical protein